MKMNSQDVLLKILHIGVSCMLFLALLDWNYFYYQLLRVVVCGVSAYTAWYFYQYQKERWTWLFGIVAILFNPFLIVALQRETWQLIDVGVGIAFILSLFSEDQLSSAKK